MARNSAPASSRWLANEWRSACGLTPVAFAVSARAACTARCTVRGESRRPPGPRNRGSSPAAVFAGAGRPRRSRSMARSATLTWAPNGTMRSLSPLPITRTVRLPQSTAERSRPIASDRRSPEPYSSSITARSRRSAGVRVGSAESARLSGSEGSVRGRRRGLRGSGSAAAASAAAPRSAA